MIPDSRMEKALTTIAELVEPLGEVSGRVAGIEHRIKIAKSQAFLESDGTVAERDAKSLVSVAYRELADAYAEAVTERDTMRTRIKFEELVVEAWRTQQANSRRGNV